ncbi:hypothetical protein Esti_006137 [Eimeria stiedai]
MLELDKPCINRQRWVDKCKSEQIQGPPSCPFVTQTKTVVLCEKKEGGGSSGALPLRPWGAPARFLPDARGPWPLLLPRHDSRAAAKQQQQQQQGEACCFEASLSSIDLSSMGVVSSRQKSPKGARELEVFDGEHPSSISSKSISSSSKSSSSKSSSSSSRNKQRSSSHSTTAAAASISATTAAAAGTPYERQQQQSSSSTGVT